MGVAVVQPQQQRDPVPLGQGADEGLGGGALGLMRRWRTLSRRGIHQVGIDAEEIGECL